MTYKAGFGWALDLAAAEARLAKLDEICFFGCPEYDLLKKAVRQRQGPLGCWAAEKSWPG